MARLIGGELTLTEGPKGGPFSKTAASLAGTRAALETTRVPT